MLRYGPLLTLLGCGPPAAPEVYDAVVRAFDETYGGFAQRGVDWDAAVAAHDTLTEGSSDDELFAALSGLLAELDDGHVQLGAPDRPVFQSNRVLRERLDDEAFDLELIREELLGGDYDSGGDDGYTAGWLTAEVAYLHLPYVGANLTGFDDLLAGFAEADALVLDLRHDRGGDFTWGFDALGRLTDRPVDVFRSRTRDGPEREDFTDWTTWSLAPRGRHVDVPIVVLTDRYTISAGERLALALATLPQVQRVGRPTNGSLATMIARTLPNGWTLTLPVQELESADGQAFEGVGVPVDVEIAADPAAVDAGRDPVIEAALALLEEER